MNDNQLIKPKKRRRGGIGRPFTKGNAPKSPGRPRKENCYADIVREMLASKEISLALTFGDGQKKEKKIKSDKPFYYGIGYAQIQKAMTGDVSAAKEIIDRTDGKPIQPIDLNVKPPLAINILPPDKINE